jgi:guanosine-3',5'-bis(diphosphate) 3'-pyrophosphohydrolase
VRDPILLAAALLHDTVEDTDTTVAELEDLFKSEVAAVVAEVTDDKSLPKEERKRLQVEHAPHLSLRARRLKTADLICNLRSFIDSPPANWRLSRQHGYLDWAEQVFDGCGGSNPGLDDLFRRTLHAVRETLRQRSASS